MRASLIFCLELDGDRLDFFPIHLVRCFCASEYIYIYKTPLSRIQSISSSRTRGVIVIVLLITWPCSVHIYTFGYCWAMLRSIVFLSNHHLSQGRFALRGGFESSGNWSGMLLLSRPPSTIVALQEFNLSPAECDFHAWVRHNAAQPRKEKNTSLSCNLSKTATMLCSFTHILSQTRTHHISVRLKRLAGQSILIV